MVTLYLISHAQAAEAGSYPDDRQRPLARKGLEQAARLRDFLGRRRVQFDQLFSSPLVRAAQTAEVLVPLLRGRRLTYLDALATDAYEALLTELLEYRRETDRRLALVGHEPYLSELASHLLTGEPQRLTITLKKAGLLVLVGEQAPGAMRLEALLAPSAYRV